MRRRFWFVAAQLAWFLASIGILSLLDILTLELLFVASFVGFLVLLDLRPTHVGVPWWRQRIRWLVILGLAAFTYIVVRRIVPFLPPEVVP